ncbi:DNA translocase FtsK [Marinifilum breve]|uniref:DNA translocase FtsK n=1 Tax=Marinifilum breve TaxID=2184082 RepID=A0A2V4A1M3_9BACT|nr:FtsK/SpoIIIE domain-containing protein [Marinifilum breve]PXY02538.1 DNA translocase FtsK [Marinifilum breve]
MKLSTNENQTILDKRQEYWESFEYYAGEIEEFKSMIDSVCDAETSLHIEDTDEYSEISSDCKTLAERLKSVVQNSNQLKDEINHSHKLIFELIESGANMEGEIKKAESNIKTCYYLFFLIVPLLFIGKYKKRKLDLQAKLEDKDNTKAELKAKIFAAKDELEKLKTSFSEKVISIENLITDYFINELNRFAIETKEQLIKKSVVNYYDWDEAVWSKWTEKDFKINSELCIGKFQEKRTNLSFNLPALVPFIGKRKTIVLESATGNSNQAKSLFESLIMRIALTLPHQVSYTFLDPNGLGETFSSIAKDVEVRENNGDTYRVLEALMEDTQRIIATYGLSKQRPFDSIADNILINEKFEMIFVADFPKQYDRREIELLQRIANNGPTAGKYVFIHHNKNFEFPRELSMDIFESTYALNFNNLSQYGGGECELEFIPDSKPNEQIKKVLIEKLKNSKPPERKVEWADEIALEKDNWWLEKAIENIETPIGRSGSSDKLNIWFGAKQSEGGRPCAHGMLAAMTGSGKSNLYHVLILGLAIRYSPAELSMYLIDGKDGVEFQSYKNLPHAEFISLKSQPKLSRSILDELLEEKERRNNLFSDHGVNDYVNFKKKHPKEVLPRILLLVDEYQELFEGDKDGLASNTLMAIAQQGRSVGIHMFLGSQRFNVVGMLHQAAIMGNIHMRIAMKMSLSDRQALTEFGKEGKLIIGNCNLPGKAVINDQSGDDGANQFGKVAIMTKPQRDELIDQLIVKSKECKISDDLLTTNIFNGSEQPDLLDNPYLNHLIKSNDWLSEEELQDFARKELHKGGLGEPDWFSGEQPVTGWLGQEFNVRGYSKIIVRRRQRENALMIGDNNEARFGMMLSLITSLVLNHRTEKNVFYIIDKTIKGAPWNKALRFITDDLLNPLGIRVKLISKNSEINDIIHQIDQELEQRKQSEDPEEEANIFLLGADLDKSDDFCQVPNKYGTMEDSELGKLLQKIFTNGPSKGIYSFFSFESVMSMLNVISKRNIDFFRHRVALQMSEDDSFTFLKKRDASRLQLDGKKPICGFYIDINNNKSSFFKPYCLSDNLYQQISEIGQTLKNR